MGRMQNTPCWIVIVAVLVTGTSGCTSPLMRWREKDKKQAELPEQQQGAKQIRDMTRVWGLRPVRVEGVGLVTGLENTGSDPPASPHRDLLIDDMQRRGVDGPSKILQMPSTALVLVRADLPPGIQKGDQIDLEVTSPSSSQTVSLRDGWLMQSRLQQMAVLDRLRAGSLMATGEGSVLVETLLEGDNKGLSETRGRVLAGTTSTISRNLGLVLSTENHSVRVSSMIGKAINERFHTYDRGTKRGVATPKRDNFIELAIHSRYRHNLVRYVRVAQAISIRESPHERLDRLSSLQAELLDPTSSVKAAVDLEAIGAEALPALREGLKSDSPLVRFSAAEAMGYMNEIEAVPHLVEAAQKESAFRWHALTALSAMTESEAREGLAELLHSSSDETRYGAFRALAHFNPRDPAVQGEPLGDVLKLHKITSDAEPLVHVRRSERAEVVLFGKQFALRTPAAIFAGKRFLIKSEDANRLKVTYFSLGQDDRSTYCPNDLETLLKVLVQLGGSYSDVVSGINDAKQKGLLAARVKFDAIPKAGRRYDLSEEEQVRDDDSSLELDEETNRDESEDGEEEIAPGTEESELKDNELAVLGRRLWPTGQPLRSESRAHSRRPV